MFTKSTFELSDSIEAILELKNAIESGHLEGFPIEQRLDALYSGCAVIGCLTKQHHDLFTDEEQDMVLDADCAIKTEIVEMGIGS